jgi:hypothetical protein
MIHLADALDLGGMEGIELPAALALLLRANLVGARQRPSARRLEIGVAHDLAGAVAHEPATCQRHL